MRVYSASSSASVGVAPIGPLGSCPPPCGAGTGERRSTRSGAPLRDPLLAGARSLDGERRPDCHATAMNTRMATSSDAPIAVDHRREEGEPGTDERTLNGRVTFR